MDHVAIMKKDVGSIEDILSGIKGIESRWMKRMRAPWNKVREGDKIYFKYSGQRIIAVAEVREVRQLELLTIDDTRRIIEEYGGMGGINLKTKDPNAECYRGKKYCVLVRLTNAQPIAEPFSIRIRGYGTAWFCLQRGIEEVRRAA